ncbi:MAG: hypothetical protein VB095_08595 [Anaerovorax sp.]|nr:hypothetical protein [Anaerovorax sp.]
MKNKEVDIYDDQSVNAWLKTIHVNKNEKMFCNLINEHDRELEKREKQKKEKYLAQLPHEILWQMGNHGYIYSNRKVVLDIQTSEKARKRAYCFLDTFITCIKELGGIVQIDTSETNDNTQFTLLQSTYICHLVEVQVKLRNVLESNSRAMRPLYETVGTGKLKFLIDEKLHINYSGKTSIKNLWSIEDDDIEKIEDKLIDLLGKLIQDALAKKIVIDLENEKRQKEYEEQIRKWDEERRQEELEKQKKILLEKRQQARLKINNHMDKWNYINQILTYVAELRENINIAEDEQILIKRYCFYVEELYDKKEFYREIIEFAKELSGLNEENI